MVLLEKESDLAGLSPSLREQAAAAAASRGKQGQWAIVNTRSSTDPFLTFSTRRDLREKVWRMFVMRGDNSDDHDNNATIARILKLRKEKATLLGYPTYAHWKLEDQMAKTPERTVELMEAVWKPAVKRVHEEVADMQAIAEKEGAKIKIEPWDYRFYSEKVRKAKYDLDENDTKPYLQLEKLREGMFYVAGELFGFKFVPALDIAVYQPDVRVKYALKYQTGQPIPDALVKKIKKAETFNQGFSTVEYLSSALVDMKLHLAKEPTSDPRKFERDTLEELGMPREIVMRHRTAQFHHIFADGYEAGYYSYLWSDTLSADAWEAFLEGSGPYDKTVAKRLHDDIFSAGNTMDPADAYRAFRGRDPGIKALMRKRGFSGSDATAKTTSSSVQ